MNSLKNFGVITLLFISFVANAQTNKATTAKIVEEKNFIFVATTAIPLNTTDLNKILGRIPGSAGGGAVSLSGSNYDLSISADTVVSYLPYYGRAYRASFDTDENSHKFTSTNFTYKTTKLKKGGWDIEINTKDVKDNVRMLLNVTENGYATLNVSSNNKQSISYNGYLMEERKKAL